VYGETVEGEGASVTLVPSGHILGAAQVLVAGAEGSTLYTGDFRLGPSRTAVPAKSPSTDALVMETTFGLPVFRFPPRPESEARMIEACRRAHEDGAVPVVLAYALGKSQEAALALTEAGISTVLHGAAWKLLPEYEAAGFSFPLSRPYESGPARPGEVLLVPPSCARTPVVRKLKRRRILYLSGWATREAARADFDADVLLPISDHADFDELMAHVERVGPSRVRTHHGYARDFARILSIRNPAVEALALTEGAERAAEDAAPEESGGSAAP
jgi:DNA ligase-1